MRLAIVVSTSSDRGSRRGALAPSSVAARLVSDRLAEPDAGFVVESLELARGLEGRVEAVLARHAAGPEPLTLLFYFAGRAALDDDGALALLAGAERLEESPLAPVARALARASDTGLVILELAHEPVPDDPTASLSVVASAREAVAAGGELALLVGARPNEPGGEGGASRFTRLVLSALDELAARSPRGGSSAVELYDAMRRDEARFFELPGLGFFKGAREFPVLARAGVPAENTLAAAPSTLRSPSGRADAAPSAAGPAPRVSSGSAELARSGDAHAAAGRHDDAIADYKRALFMLGSKRGVEHASLYVKIGDAKRALGKSAEAIHNYDKALGIEPALEPAFEAACELIEAARDWDHLERFHQRRLQSLDSPTERAAVWVGLGQRWLDDASDPERAARAFERALTQDPADGSALEGMARANTALGRHAAANTMRRRWASALAEQPARRAAVLVEAARVAHAELRQPEEAIELGRQALESEPTALVALELVAPLLDERRRWGELAELYELALGSVTEPAVERELALRLGVLRRDRLGERERALASFERALALTPDDTALFLEAAELHRAGGDVEGELTLARRVAPAQPVTAAFYRRALDIFERAGEPDAAWSAASVLELIGEADINESLLVAEHRPEGLIAAREPLDERAWSEGLFFPERDRELAAVLGAVAEAAVAVQIAALREQGKLPALDPAARQEPEKSTLTIVRSLVWTSRLLGLPMPALYVLKDTASELGVVPALEPTAVASRTVASGLELADLAFLWGRHLTCFRSEFSLLVFYPTLRELGSLLLAALTLSGAQEEAASLGGEVVRLTGVLDAALGDAARSRLSEAAARFEPKNTRKRIERWARSVHLVGARAGLLACGDLGRAAALVRRFPGAGGLSVEAQLDDLAAWSIGAEHAELRRRLGIALG
ncbi:MAG: hypothetical protein OZ921_17475 [Sorangiineae bacterium]|nr:hypothetical protein [Polyangiaceae bacterium]MEB2324309.1 hypothetical protein [Sorangiineae bacterium]